MRYTPTKSIGAWKAAKLVADAFCYDETMSSTVIDDLEPRHITALASEGKLHIVGVYKDNPLYNVDELLGIEYEVWEKVISNYKVVNATDAAGLLNIRRCDFVHMIKLHWITPTCWHDMIYSRKTARTPFFLKKDVLELPTLHPEVSWVALRSTSKGERSLILDFYPKDGR